jgi:hypothetical protein
MELPKVAAPDFEHPVRTAHIDPAQYELLQCMHDREEAGYASFDAQLDARRAARDNAEADQDTGL